MRNRYRVALRTYRRPAFLAVLIAAGGWIVMLGLMISLCASSIKCRTLRNLCKIRCGKQ